jgi:hypothetical protein
MSSDHFGVKLQTCLFCFPHFLFIFGFFTQLAIAYSHIGNDNATRATVLLFSVAFSISIALLTYIDNPHATSSLVSTSILNDVK